MFEFLNLGFMALKVFEQMSVSPLLFMAGLWVWVWIHLRDGVHMDWG